MHRLRPGAIDTSRILVISWTFVVIAATSAAARLFRDPTYPAARHVRQHQARFALAADHIVASLIDIPVDQAGRDPAWRELAARSLVTIPDVPAPLFFLSYARVDHAYVEKFFADVTELLYSKVHISDCR